MHDRTTTALAALIFVVFALYCFNGAFGPFHWGHNGFNGAAFSQAARNALRFGTTGQALYYTGVTPPGAELIYTHHPQLLHAHLVAAFKLFGDERWVGRMIPALYSLATLALIHRIATRLWDRMTAVAAIALYAFTPLHAIFANMIDHEQGAIFWSLLAVYQYVRWLDDRRSTRVFIVLFAISCAAQFDWPAYYIAFFVFVHALARRKWGFSAMFALVVLANFALYFLWVRAVRGGLSEMAHAFQHRTGAAPRGSYLSRLWMFAGDLYGPVPLLAVLAWLVTRVRRRRTRDLIPGVFLAAQLIHSVVFKGAGWIHAYWTYYLGVAIALGGGEVVVALFRRHILARIAVAAAVLHLGARSFVQLRWGLATGSAAYELPYPNQELELRVAEWLGQKLDRSSTRYLVHASLPVRIEFYFYLDSPYDERADLELLPVAERTIVLVDTSRSGARSAVARLVAAHEAWVFDRRIVAIDLASRAPRLTALRTETLESSFVHDWFVDPLHAPARFVPDDAALARAGLEYSPITFEHETTRQGGPRIEWDCPRGEAVTAIESVRGAEGVLRVRAICRSVSSPWFGGGGEGAATPQSCGQSALGIVARTTRFVDTVSLLCGDEPPVEGTVRIRCPNGTVMRGLRGRASALVDGVGIACGP